MEEPVIKIQFIARVKQALAEWNNLLAQMDAEYITNRPVCEQWTTKDLIAHTNWYAQEMIISMRARALVGSKLWELPIDEMNRVICAENQSRSLEELIQEAEQVASQLLVE